MADKYWINGNGAWNNNAKWSTTSGGVNDTTKPTSTDDVFIDNNSGFTGADPFIEIPTSPPASNEANCRDLNWTFNSASQEASIRWGANNTVLNVFGNLNIADGPTGSGKSRLTGNAGVTTAFLALRGSGTFTMTITGNTFPCELAFVAGTRTLPEDINISVVGFAVVAGTCDTGNFNITAPKYRQTSSGTFTMGSSTITLSGTGTVWAVSGVGGTINSDTSTIILNGNSVTFDGDGKTYYNVEFLGTPSTILGANTFNELTIAAGKQVNFEQAVTQTIDTMTAIGTPSDYIFFRSTGVNRAILCVTTWNIAYVDMKDINASSSCSSVTCPTCIDSGNNLNVNLGEAGGAFLLNYLCPKGNCYRQPVTL